MAAKFASKVVITDGSEIALQLIRYNIERNFSSLTLPTTSKSNSCHVTSQKLRWGQETREMFHQFDIVLASDVVYPSPIFVIEQRVHLFICLFDSCCDLDDEEKQIQE